MEVARALVDLNTTAAHCEALPHPGTLGLALGAVLAIGVFLSYLPQQIKLVVRRSSAGLSSQMLLFSGIQNTCSAINIVLVTLPDLACCPVVSFGFCQELMLGVYQIGSPSVQTLLVFVLLLVFHPSWRREPEGAAVVVNQPNEGGSDDDVPEVLVARAPVRRGGVLGALDRLLDAVGGADASLRFAAWAFASYVALFVVLCSCLAAGLVVRFGARSDAVTAFSETLGLVAAVFTIAQWLPQIVTTWRSGHVGSLSMTMLALQAPGGLFVFVFNAFIQPSPWSTWLPLLFSSVQQFFLLALCIVYTLRDWRVRSKASVEEEQSALLKGE